MDVDPPAFLLHLPLLSLLLLLLLVYDLQQSLVVAGTCCNLKPRVHSRVAPPPIRVRIMVRVRVRVWVRARVMVSSLN